MISLVKKKTLLLLVMVGLSALAIIALALLLVDSKLYSKAIDQELISLARKNRSLLSIQESDVGFIYYYAAKAKILPARSLIGFEIDSLTLKPKLFSLLHFNLALNIDFSLYAGQAQLSAQKGIFSDVISLDGYIENLELTQHPAIDGFGIRTAKLNAKAKELVIVNKQIVSGQAQLEINDLNKPIVTNFSLKAFGLPLDLKIPKITEAGCNLKCNFHTAKQADCKLQLDSNLATVEGQVQIVYSQATSPSLDLTAKIELKQAGQSEFASYLPLISSNTLDSETKNFKLLLSGPLASPKIKFTH